MSIVSRAVRRVRRRLDRVHDERGFTLVEMMIAQGVILASLVTIAYTATIGFSDIALARQRDGANGLANRVMEQVRALPFDTLERGLANSDLPGGDPAIVSSGCPNGAAYCYRSAPSAALETIARGANATVEPLVPHRATVTVGSTEYTRAVYVTYYNNDTTLNAFRVTVSVTWENPARNGVDAEVSVQSVLYSPPGCTSTATHPFAAPCQPFLYGQARNPAGAIQISGIAANTSIADANLFLPAQSSTMQVEQISAVQGTVTTAGLSMQLLNQAESVVGRETVSSSADSDPTQAGSDYSTATASGNSVVLGSGGTSPVSLSLGTSNTGTTTSTTSASTTNSCASQLDAQPCGRSIASQTNSLSAGVALTSGLLNLGTANLVSIASYSTTGTTDRNLDSSGDGRIAVSASRTIGEVRVGGLPSLLSALLTPVGFQGYLVRLSGYSDTVTAQSGANTSAPAVTTAGTISVWNGFGYTNVAVNPGASATIPVTSLTINNPITIGGPLSIGLSATVRTGGTTTASTSKTCSPTPCLNTRTAASATANSPIVVDLSLSVVLAGNTIIDLDVHVDLGALEATGTYKESPSA